MNSREKTTLLESLRAGTDLGEGSIVPLVDAMLREAVRRRASDIHLEPVNGAYRLRYRIDGTFLTVGRYPLELGSRLNARMKVMSRLQVYKTSTPQEGRIHMEGVTELDLRTSFFPTINGEKTVIRIFSFSKEHLTLEALGFAPGLLEQLRQVLCAHQGNFFVVGPAGVGKTTTLYACVKEIHDSGGASRSLATIEDPVENNLGFVAQTEINPAMGLSFATALRSLLRQDPEVIMVGEIRDPETASIAVQAGLTGHLVLSTVHTDRASSLFSRLMDLDCSLPLLLASVAGILSQRLVRRLCDCREVHEYPEELLVRFGLPSATLYRARGCEQCLGTGYSGRAAVGELLMLTREVKRALRVQVPQEDLEELAARESFVPMRESARRLVAEGVTSLEEVLPLHLEVGK